MTLKEVAKNHGLTPEGVDYALTQYQIVMCEITHGMMSKLSYDAHDIIRVAQKRWCNTCDLKKQEEKIEVKHVVRCRDCKHRPIDHREEYNEMTGFGLEFPDEHCPCQCEDDYYNWFPGDDWFCANGERRGENAID